MRSSSALGGWAPAGGEQRVTYGQHDMLPPREAGIAGLLPRRHEGHEGARSPAAAPTTKVGGVASCLRVLRGLRVKESTISDHGSPLTAIRRNSGDLRRDRAWPWR